VLGQDSYEVQKYHDRSASVRKYKSCDLYLLPPVLFPHQPIDAMDQRYLNYSYAPIVSPLQKPLKIEMYNDTQLGLLHDSNASTYTKRVMNSVDHFAFQQETSTPSTDASKESATSATSLSPSIEQLKYPKLQDLDGTLFFIKYTVANTLRPRWYLVQVDAESTAEVNQDYQNNGKVWCVFLAKHPNDMRKSDEFSRWWPDWYEYKVCDKTRQLIFGDRILFRPNVTPSSSKFVQWASLITLFGEDHNSSLVGPFNFEKVEIHTNMLRQKVALTHWNELVTQCESFGLTPPTLGAQNSLKAIIKESGSKRKRP